MQGSLKEVVSFSFNHRIAKSGCAVGLFDDSEQPKLAVGTASNKVVLQDSESIFHVSEPITWIDVLPPQNRATSDVHCDLVVVGTERSLLVFDVYYNKTIFHRDMPEGVNCIKIGRLDEFKEDIIVCGCGSTLWGIDAKGDDLFWTTLGDEVHCIEFCDIDGDGLNELIVGTSGQEIKTLKSQSLLRELMEGDPCLQLRTVSAGTFAFGLLNGVIGVYKKWERLWRLKTKHQIASLKMFPEIPGSDTMFLACVWHNGKVDIRDASNGENKMKAQLDGEVADAVVTSPKHGHGKQMLVLYTNGKVRGVELNPDQDDVDQEVTVLHEFGQRKHNLMEELRNYEATEQRESGQPGIPVSTQMECTLELNPDRGLLLHVQVSNDIPIKAVLMFAEGIFPSECYAIHPNVEMPGMVTIIRPLKNAATVILMRVLIGTPGSTQLRVLEFDRNLPRFPTYVLVNELAEQPDGYVMLDVACRSDLLNRWLQTNFLVNEESLPSLEENKWSVTLKCCYTKDVLQIEVTSSDRIIVRHNRIEMAGEIVQSLVQFFEVKQMSSRASFSQYQTELGQLVSSMEDRYAVTDKLTAEWTERLNFIRETVVRAEDALATGQTTKARKLYVRVAMLNRECVSQRQILTNATDGLVTALRQLNNMIKYNAQLKVGEDANELVKECRKLLAAEKFSALGKRLQFSTS